MARGTKHLFTQSRGFGRIDLIAVLALVVGMAVLALPPKWARDPTLSWQSLLEPFSRGAPLPGGFRIESTERGPENDVVISAAREQDHSSIEVHILPQTRWSGVRQSRSYAIGFEIPHSPAAEPDRQAVTEAIAETLRAHDHGLPAPDAIPLVPSADQTVLPWWLENLRGLNGMLFGASLCLAVVIAFFGSRTLAIAGIALALLVGTARIMGPFTTQLTIPMQWGVPAAALILLVVLRKDRLPASDRLAVLGVLASGLALRLGLGAWGPLRINGIGPLWIQGAARDPAAIAAYGPGYTEIFGQIAALAPTQPDWAIFTCNAVISAFIPVLAFALARSLGLERGAALASALLLVIDPVAIRMAATESYFPPIILLCTAAALTLTHANQIATIDRRRAMAAVIAATLLLLQAVRIHPSAWGPAMTVPFAILAAPRSSLARRAAFFLVASATILATTIATSTNVLLDVLGHVRNGVLMQPPAPATWPLAWVIAAGVVYVLIGKHRRLVFAAGVPCALAMATRHAYGQSWIWRQCYDHLYLTVPVIAVVSLLVGGRRNPALQGILAASTLGAWLLFGREIVTGRTTDHLEYRWLRQQLAQLPPDCHVIHLASAGKRGMYIPTYVGPERTARIMDDREPHTIEEALMPAPCVYYVHTSLCSSVEGRSLCDAIEGRLGLTIVARATFPARPSNDGLPYDRDSIETSIARVDRFDGQPAP